MRNRVNDWIYTTLPGWVEKAAYLKIIHPRGKKISLEDEFIFSKAEILTSQFQGFQLKVFKWGKGRKSILLVNGWDGQPGYFAKMASSFSRQGYVVYAFELPNRKMGLRSLIYPYQYSQIIYYLIDYLKVDHVASHCLGGLATTYALFEQRNFQLDRFLLISTLNRFQNYIGDISLKNNISDDLRLALTSRLDMDMKGIHRWNMCNLIPYVRSLVNKVLVIHDRQSSVLPYLVAEKITSKWHGALLHPIDNIGHKEALKSSAAIDKALEFFTPRGV